jgi:membrane protease YdiL (CAAX protease family)
VHFDTSRATLPSSTRLTALALLIYVPLGVGALGWAWFGQGRRAWTLETPTWNAAYGSRLVVSLLLGAAIAGAVVAMTPTAVQRWTWARELHRELAPIFESLSPSSITVLAVASGLGEELFFRGAMQPVLGLWITSAIFGVLHTGPKRLFLAWSIWAFVIGLLLGWIFEFTGVLWGPIVAHAWINQRNMNYMRRH